jgi:diguanylate cyclase (GGDEF)-like protein
MRRMKRARSYRRAPPRRSTPQAKVFAFSALLAEAAAALVLIGPLAHQRVIHAVADEPLSIAIILVLFAVADFAPVSVHWNGRVSHVVLSEVPLLLGLAIVQPWVLVLGRVLADVGVFGGVRRQPPHKLAYNVSCGAAGTATAATVYRAVLGSHGVLNAFGWLAGASALAVAVLFAHITIRVVWFLYDQPQNRNNRSEVAESLLVAVTSIGLAFVGLDAAWEGPWALVPLVVVGVLVVFTYRGYLLLTDRFGALSELYDVSRFLASAKLESARTCWAILEQVQTVLRVQRAELVILDRLDRCRRLVIEGENKWSSDEEAPGSDSVLGTVISSGKAFMHSPRVAREAHDPYLGRYQDVLVVPFDIAGSVLGALVARDRQDGSKPFDEDDVLLFGALAGQAGTALERAQLFEELLREAESKAHQATHDTLTGLANRALFVEEAAAALTETGSIAIALLDLDRFKDVNDSLGHATGDALLREVAACLVSAAGDRATVARLGGDEFAIVMAGITDPEQAMQLLRELEDALAVPVDVEGITLAVTASAGVSIAPEHGMDVATLLQHADIAMYSAKARHSGVELFSAAEDRIKYRLILGGHLSSSLIRGEHLTVVYQPIASFATRTVTRVEALTRWSHPMYAEPRADEIIALAEQMGLVCQIRDLVLRDACGYIAGLRREGLAIELAVNLSGRDLSDPHLVANVTERLAESRLDASALTLELTETELMADIDEASKVLAELGEIGVHISVDDYGTGYSSLAYLHKLPIEELKLDSSFVSKVSRDAGSAIIVRSSIAMAQALGLWVVAEGAEDGLTCAVLANAGCDFVQGYYLARPMPATALKPWLEASPRLLIPDLPVGGPSLTGTNPLLTA